jgi:hypothetical protein|tara:strand:+ start:1854 stop:2048 length:195 start_codon:yes stop_codon:yes gene_type:complete
MGKVRAVGAARVSRPRMGSARVPGRQKRGFRPNTMRVRAAARRNLFKAQVSRIGIRGTKLRRFK